MLEKYDRCDDTKFNLKVTQEVYTESHTDNMDKELHKRILTNEEGTVKIIIEKVSGFSDTFNRGEPLEVEFKQLQSKLK